MSNRRRESPREYASPPCSLHELEELEPPALHEPPAPQPAGDTNPLPDPTQRSDVMRWRKTERARLIAERLAIPSHARRDLSDRIALRLIEAIGDAARLIVSTYAPFRGEPGLASLVRNVVAHGGRHALPVVIERGQPLVFRLWAPGEPLERGIWNIPQPPADAAAVVPDVIIAPIVGFARDCFRLGYGGGFYDRTLASLPSRPRVFGVGYAQAMLSTIYPLPHDVRMTAIVTEDGIFERG